MMVEASRDHLKAEINSLKRAYQKAAEEAIRAKAAAAAANDRLNVAQQQLAVLKPVEIAIRLSGMTVQEYINYEIYKNPK